MSAKMPHPKPVEVVEGILEQHAGRMDIVRLHQRAEDAENAMGQAQLIASMEAKAQEQTRAELGRVLQEMENMKREREEFLRKMQMRESKNSDAARTLEQVMEHVSQLKADLQESKTQVTMLMNEKRTTDEQVKKIFDERGRMEAGIMQLETELRNEKRKSKEEHDRLFAIGQGAQGEAERLMLTLKRDFAERESNLQAQLTEKTRENLDLSSELQDKTTRYENKIGDLEQIEIMKMREIVAEKEKSAELQAKIEGIEKTIWLRKYDATSPRKPNHGFVHARQSDPHASSGTGMYAGQVGYSRAPTAESQVGY